MKRTKIPSSERKIEWVGGLSTQTSPNNEGQLFAGGANELDEGKQSQDESHETFSKVPEPSSLNHQSNGQSRHSHESKYASERNADGIESSQSEEEEVYYLASVT
jgi:hypothetical protein